MVKGLEVFKKYFANFENQYVIIGGAGRIFYSSASSWKLRF